MKTKMTKKLLALLLVCGMTLATTACGGQSSGTADSGADTPAGASSPAAASKPADEKIRIAFLLKFEGSTLQPRQEEGLQEFMEDHPNVEAFAVGPTTGDAVEQNRMFNDLIAQGVDIVIVCPNSTDATAPVAKQAREAGIVVIGHEAAGMDNLDYDLEAFDNTAFGAEMASFAAELAGGKGEYASFVGSLTAASHVTWVDGGEAIIQSEYPDIKIVASKNESNEDMEQAYNKTVELFKTYPELSIIQGSAGADIMGAARAIEESGLQDSTYVVGTGTVRDNAQYLKSGALDKVYLWDPGAVAYVACEIGMKVLNGETVSAGDSFSREGYESVGMDGNVVYGSAWLGATQAEIDAGTVPEWYLNM